MAAWYVIPMNARQERRGIVKDRARDLSIVEMANCNAESQKGSGISSFDVCREPLDRQGYPHDWSVYENVGSGLPSTLVAVTGKIKGAGDFGDRGVLGSVAKITVRTLSGYGVLIIKWMLAYRLKAQPTDILLEAYALIALG